MCGITGYININQKPVADTGIILKMMKVQKHRGPDDSGIRAFSLKDGQSFDLSVDRPVRLQVDLEGILGFNRLSILDLSINGHQPMVSPEGNVILALNGEIYNAFDFTHELQDWGYRFKSTSDTEVVLALYLKYGFTEMLHRLNGMFAIAVADLGRKKLFIARDRFGIKPMYYIVNDRILGFSSELKSLAYLEGFDFQLNPAKIDEFMLFRNNLTDTLFENVASLRPGHFIEYSHDTGIILRQYFNADGYIRAESNPADFNEFTRDTELRLGRSVGRQLMSDVKLGCQLSGGIDSSLVTWLANQKSNKGQFESVSIIFENENFSEEKYINHVSNSLGITAHKFILNPDYFVENIEKATWHLESPINHPNTIGIYKLSQDAKQHVTVLLSGEGADEVFGGYPRFYDLIFPYKSKRLLQEIHRFMNDPAELVNYVKDYHRAVMATAYMTPYLAGRLKPDFRKQKAITERIDLYNSLAGSRFDKQIKYELITFLPDLLIRQDKMSMAHSIENRVPFLDNNVVEFAFSIPQKHLLLRRTPEGLNNEKYLLKKITAGVFGHDFAFRNKMGFGIPLREFFMNSRFREYIMDRVLSGIKARNLYDHDLIASWVANIKNLEYNEMEALWIMISFEIWASVYLDRKNENRYTQFAGIL